MKTSLTIDSRHFKGRGKKQFEILKEYFLLPAWGGLLGFALFFSLLILLKIFSYIIESQSDLTVDLTDILISFIGFILLFSVRFLEKFQK